MNIKVISRNVGYALLVSALFMFLSILVSLSRGNDSALAALMISFTITFIVGIFPFIFVRKTPEITMKDGFMIIVLSWLLSFVFGMLPYALWGGPFSVENAWFESVSGFTATGATILENVEMLPDSLLFWRSSTHFIGGLGVVVFLLLVIPNSSQMRLRLTNMELSSLSKQGYNSRSNRTVWIFTCVYFAILAASFLSYLLCGMKPFDALNHAMSVTATGGFSTKNASIGAFDSVAVDLVTMVFMVLSSKNDVFRFYAGVLVVLSVIVTISLKVNGIEQTWGASALSGAFHVISYASTSGFGIADNSAWPVLPSSLLLFAGICCGMAGSTTGGLKADRVLLLFKEVRYHIKQTIHPASVNEVRVNGKVVRQDDVAPHILYIALYMAVVILSVSLTLFFDRGNQYALPATISSLGNVGPAIGVLGVMGNFGAQAAGAKFMYTVDMFLGRVEIYPVLAVLMMLFNRRTK